MGRGKSWSEDHIEKAISLVAAGMNYVEIGKLLGRTPVAVKDAIARRQPSQRDRANDKPLGETHDDRQRIRDAQLGSARLRDEIQRVFGGAA